jgi:hypothetical protein
MDLKNKGVNVRTQWKGLNIRSSDGLLWTQWWESSGSIIAGNFFTVRITVYLTPWIRVLLEKLVVTQLVKKYPAIYGTRKFITVFTRAHHRVPILSQMHQVYNFLPYFSRIHFNIILPTSLDLPSGLFPRYCFQWAFPVQTPNITCSKSHVHFPLPRSFQRILPSPKPCVTFRNKRVCTVRIC